MAQPTVVCLELRWPKTSEPWVRCVALPGRTPGLGLAHDGSILWQAGDGVACSLGISGDDQLILVCAPDAPATRVLRSGRSLEVPAGKLVVLLHGDELELSGLRWRVHVHGPARAILPPRPLSLAAWAAAAVLAASAANCTPSAPPPSAATDASAQTSSLAAGSPESGASDAPPDAPADGSLNESSVDAADDARSDAEAGSDAAPRRKPRPASTPPRKQPIEVRDFPPYVD